MFISFQLSDNLCNEMLNDVQSLVNPVSTKQDDIDWYKINWNMFLFVLVSIFFQCILTRQNRLVNTNGGVVFFLILQQSKTVTRMHTANFSDDDCICFNHKNSFEFASSFSKILWMGKGFEVCIIKVEEN